MSLFKRESQDDDIKARAHRILDDAKAGLDVDLRRINWALRMTGDLTDQLISEFLDRTEVTA